jgi:AcrR family transcriptional regulator
MPRLADRRAKIELLRAAEAAFAEHGLSAAKVEDITSRAGVSKGAFYLHFDSKEDCWREIVEGFIARLAARIEPPVAIAQAGPATIEQMLELWRAQDVATLEFCWQNKALLGMILAGGGGAPYSYLVDEFAERAAAQAEEWVRYAKVVGLYREDIDEAITATIIAGAYDRLARELIRQPKRPDIEAWCQQAQDLFMRGLLREPTAQGRADDVDRKVTSGERASNVEVPAGRERRKRARAV